MFLLVLSQGSQASPQLAGVNLAYLSSCSRGVWPLLKLQQGTWGSSRVVAGNQSSIGVEMGVLGFLTSCNNGEGPPLELQE